MVRLKMGRLEFIHEIFQLPSTGHNIFQARVFFFRKRADFDLLGFPSSYLYRLLWLSASAPFFWFPQG